MSHPKIIRQKTFHLTDLFFRHGDPLGGDRQSYRQNKQQKYGQQTAESFKR